MEHTRPPASTHDSEVEASPPGCASCGAPLHEARCQACGAAAVAGGHRILRVLHEGAQSHLYLAEAQSGGKVALKELIFARAPDAKALDDFAREGQLLRQLDHPAIPRLLATFQEGSGAGVRFYLAQELVEGQSLSARLGEHRFTAAEAEQIARQVLPVLEYLHGLSPPVLHRDLKPANLILRDDGSIALVDFGSAREVRPGGTHRATVTGTFGYLPPETLGGTVDETADLFGLGATLINLLTRRPPEELLWEADPPRLSDAIQAPPAFLGWLSRLTARRRADRFSSAAEARAALDTSPDGVAADVAAVPMVSAAFAAQWLDRGEREPEAASLWASRRFRSGTRPNAKALLLALLALAGFFWLIFALR